MKGKSEPEIETFLDFLNKLKGQEIAATTAIGVWTGKISEFDDKHIVLEDSDGMSILKVNEIIAIDWAPKFEIVAP
jgi:hypothetical protein